MATAFPLPAPITIDAAIAVIIDLPEPLLHRVALRLIDRLDELTGDSDVEEVGLEDDFTPHRPDGPGCPVSDCDHCAASDDDPERLLSDGSPGDADDAEDDDPEDDDRTGIVLPFPQMECRP